MTDEELALLALETGREAAELLLGGWDDVRPVATKSTRHDLVTQMDRRSERLIRERLAAARPGDAVLGEEEGDTGTVGADGVRWVVDPLDGTVNYFYGQQSWAVSIAAERAGAVVAGAVVAPALREEYTASADGGSWAVADGRRERLQVSQVDRLSDAMVSTGFGYDPQRRGRQGRIAAAMLPQVRDIRRIGAAAVDLCWVARGRIDAHYECGLNYWDWAAGALIVSEAGGTAADLGGGPPATDMTIAGPVPLVRQLQHALREAGASDCL